MQELEISAQSDLRNEGREGVTREGFLGAVLQICKLGNTSDSMSISSLLKLLLM